MGEYGAELTQKKNELIANVIMGKLTYEQAISSCSKERNLLICRCIWSSSSSRSEEHTSELQSQR